MDISVNQINNSVRNYIKPTSHGFVNVTAAQAAAPPIRKPGRAPIVSLDFAVLSVDDETVETVETFCELLLISKV